MNDGTATTALLAITCIVLYWLPTILGWKKANRTAILVLNLLLGWTVVGWIVALIWSLTTEQQPQQIVIVNKTQQ
jgi:predicted membrane channel-forming protein YqfA (hemolysin III family)